MSRGGAIGMPNRLLMVSDSFSPAYSTDGDKPVEREQAAITGGDMDVVLGQKGPHCT